MHNLTSPKQYHYFFIAPPGSCGGQVVSQVCEEKGGYYLNFGEYMKRELSENTNLAPGLANHVKEQRISNNSDILKVFKSAFESSKKHAKDLWILGYPKTKIQALKIRDLKILPDCIMILNKDRDTCIKNLVEYFTKDGSDENTALVKANESLDEYYHFLKGVKQTYQSSIIESDLNDPDIKKILGNVSRYTSYQSSPKRAPRI